MKLYVTDVSPYARLARILVLEKGLSGRVDVIPAQTRTANSPYYQINPSGRVPYLIDDAGVGMEDSQLICAYLDGLDGKPRFHRGLHEADWAYRRLEATARSFCDGLSVWVREKRRPANEQSPTVLAHEVARAGRLADVFEVEAGRPMLREPLCMVHFLLAVSLELAHARSLGDLTAGRPALAAWLKPISALASMRATAPPRMS